ncbi:MAG: hypothetical protein ABSG76_25250 [Xanthobacteraceae bacterium]|jgi:hypothetical protein
MANTVDFLNEADKGACPDGRRPASRKHCPEIVARQFPILDDCLDRAIRDLGRKHPFGSNMCMVACHASDIIGAQAAGWEAG